MQQENVGSVRKKDVEGELRWICAQMPLVYVVSRNVKERIADTPLVLVSFYHQEYYGKMVQQSICFVVIF